MKVNLKKGQPHHHLKILMMIDSLHGAPVLDCFYTSQVSEAGLQPSMFQQGLACSKSAARSVALL